jgi:hypothetical protein
LAKRTQIVLSEQWAIGVSLIDESGGGRECGCAIVCGQNNQNN